MIMLILLTTFIDLSHHIGIWCVMHVVREEACTRCHGEAGSD